ncbi:GlsB/YeaQ/YmgE family stress response membrane protein, partial [Enterococcus faecalis]|uniref:GlsB/YeaQ/YmgE family stress response membrane protein n=1 Tax=Enterococcus faecalis TaxID=1351 RepID=UPI003D6C645F
LWGFMVGAVTGAFAGALTSKGQSMGWIGNIVAGLVGSFIGEKILGSWSPHVAGRAIVPSIIGSVILVADFSFFFGRK